MAVPAVVTAGVTGALLGYRLDAPLPKLPAIPFGDAVSLQLDYVHTVRGVLRDPLHPSSMGATLTLDLARFFPVLR